MYLCYRDINAFSLVDKSNFINQGAYITFDFKGVIVKMSQCCHISLDVQRDTGFTRFEIVFINYYGSLESFNRHVGSIAIINTIRL